MKKLRIVTAVVIAAALTGCANDGTSSESSSASFSTSSSVQSADNGGGVQSSSSESSSESSVDSSAESEPQVSEPESSEETDDPENTFLVGLAGDVIRRSELTMIFTSSGTDGDPAEFSEENFSGVVCDGFVYLAEPSGVCRTSYDDADVFDGESLRFTDVSETPKKDYKRVSVGETFCGLTLKQAEVNFAHGLDSTEYTLGDGSVKLGSELGFPEIYFMGGMAAFEGEATMTGYMCAAPEDEYNVAEGDIIFVPSGCECTMPVMGYRFDPDVGTAHFPRINTRGGMYWENEYGYVYLGNAVYGEVSADVSALPEDGSFVKVSVTVDNIKFTCGINMMDTCTADIVDFEIL
ncbi:MAG: hypothetical protein NC299_00880 [Lachnospiraceae bacterium]|nr:hypothetical protein [Ruminococcus sp.]MCM1273901.1 hypothetical protein [Lachnospiraceae bacterium]